VNVLIDAFAGRVAKRWAAQVAAATLVFWSMGVLLALVTRGPVVHCAEPAGDRAVRLPSAGCIRLPQGASATTLLGFAAVSAVAGSGLLVAAATPRLLDLLTGAGWPQAGRRGLGPRSLLRLLLRRQLRRRRAAARTWFPPPAPLAAPAPTATAPASAALVAGRKAVRRAAERRHLDAALAGVADAAASARLRRYPWDARLLAPTTIGNVYAAMGERVDRRHGLDLAVCWESLITVLPAEALATLARESARVSLRAQNLLWALAGSLWALLLPFPVSLAWVAGVVALLLLVHAGLRDACATHADVVEALLTSHRGELYVMAGITPSTTTALEPAAGRALTAYLAGHGALDLPLHWRTAETTTGTTTANDAPNDAQPAAVTPEPDPATPAGTA